MKKIFENAIWWSGVVMVGLILGISLQFVRAWTEPTQAPPGGNVGAPINTSALLQIKAGILGAAGLVTNSFQLNGTPPPGWVLTAQPDPANPAISNGTVAWAPPSGGEGDIVPSGVSCGQGFGTDCVNWCEIYGFCQGVACSAPVLCQGISPCKGCPEGYTSRKTAVGVPFVSEAHECSEGFEGRFHNYMITCIKN